MGRRPKAADFENVVLPGFEQPEKIVKTRSKKQEADAAKVSYVRHTAKPRALCGPCVVEHSKGERSGVNAASYERRHEPDVRFLCNYHTQESRHRDSLGGLLGPAK